MRPVVMRFWAQHELFDGTYIVDDLIDILAAMEALNAERS